MILLNFKDTVAKVNTGFDYRKSKVLIGNYYNSASTDVTLQPYEAVVIELN